MGIFRGNFFRRGKWIDSHVKISFKGTNIVPIDWENIKTYQFWNSLNLVSDHENLMCIKIPKRNTTIWWAQVSSNTIWALSDINGKNYHHLRKYYPHRSRFRGTLFVLHTKIPTNLIGIWSNKYKKLANRTINTQTKHKCWLQILVAAISAWFVGVWSLTMA